MVVYCATCRMVQLDRLGACPLCGEAPLQRPLGRLHAPPRRWRPVGLAEVVGGGTVGEPGELLCRSYELVDRKGGVLLRHITQPGELVIDSQRGQIRIEGPVLLEGATSRSVASARELAKVERWGDIFGFTPKVSSDTRLVGRFIFSAQTVLARGPAVVQAVSGVGYRQSCFELQALRGRPGQPVVLKV